VRFNGVEVGRVKSITIISLDEKNRARLPQIRPQDLDNLPLTDAHRAELRRFKPLPPNADGAARAKWDEEFQAAALQYAADRNMIELTLEVLSPKEKEAVRRYRADDQIRITTTLLGDTSVEVSSGSSQEAPPPDKVILGISGSFFDNLSNSVEKVRDILQNVNEVVGAQERESVRKALRRFDAITQKIENIVEFADKRLPATWDKVDGLADAAQKDLTSVTETITGLKPQLTRTLETAEAAVKDLQGKLGGLADEAKGAVVEVKGQLKPILEDVYYITDHSKEDIPLLVKNSKDLALRLKTSADKLDGVLNTTDRLLGESYPDLRRLILSLRMTGENAVEATDLIKRKPWLLMNAAKDGSFDQAQTSTQKLETAMKRFRELSAELMAVRRNLPAQPNKAQLERLDFLVQELNILCDVLEYSGDAARRQIAEPFPRKPRLSESPEAPYVPNK
jgi:ABC-type transporter Mla subunit MlaD